MAALERQIDIYSDDNPDLAIWTSMVDRYSPALASFPGCLPLRFYLHT